jgi:hypothetical protein
MKMGAWFGTFRAVQDELLVLCKGGPTPHAVEFYRADADGIWLLSERNPTADKSGFRYRSFWDAATGKLGALWMPADVPADGSVITRRARFHIVSHDPEGAAPVTQADRETEIACWYDSTRDELVRAERHALTAPADQRWVEVYRYRFDFGMVSWSWSGAGREVLPVDHTEAITATGPIKVFGVDLDGVVGWRWVLGDGGLPPPLTAEPRPVLASPPPPPPPPPAPRPKRPSWIERMGL